MKKIILFCVIMGGFNFMNAASTSRKKRSDVGDVTAELARLNSMLPNDLDHETRIQDLERQFKAMLRPAESCDHTAIAMSTDPHEKTPLIQHPDRMVDQMPANHQHLTARHEKLHYALVTILGLGMTVLNSKAFSLWMSGPQHK